MSYYLHNKYDKNSIEAIKSLDEGVTVFDVYTELEKNYEKYKWLDTSAMPGEVSSLKYITPTGFVEDGVVDESSALKNIPSIIINQIQYGYSAVASNKPAVVPIAPADPNKYFIIINGHQGSNGRYGVYAITNKGVDSFTVQHYPTISTLSTYDFGWQLIEFK